jgi:hypothetical protein
MIEKPAANAPGTNLYERAPGNARDNPQTITLSYRSIQPVQIADVFLAQEQVYEGPQLSSTVEQVRVQGGIAGDYIVQYFSDGATLDAYFTLAVCVGPQGGGNFQGGHSHP